MPQLFGIGTSVFVQNDGGEILILKRTHSADAAWYVPGGGIEVGEMPEECARRVLKLETGLEISGPMQLVAVTPMFAYDQDIFLLAYAGKHGSGDVALSEDHEAHRWLAPQEYKDAYFSDEQVNIIKQENEVAAEMATSVRAELDTYLDWLTRRGGI